jgi:hypothetical protein
MKMRVRMDEKRTEIFLEPVRVRDLGWRGFFNGECGAWLAMWHCAMRCDNSIAPARRDVMMADGWCVLHVLPDAPLRGVHPLTPRTGRKGTKTSNNITRLSEHRAAETVTL